MAPGADLPHEGICACSGRDRCAHTQTAMPPQDAHVTAHTCSRAQTLWVPDTQADGPDTASGACSLERSGPQPLPSLILPARDSPSALRAPTAAVRGHPSPTALSSARCARPSASLARASRAGKRRLHGGLESALRGGQPVPRCRSGCWWPGGANPQLGTERRGGGGQAPRQSQRAAWRDCGAGGAPGSRCWRCPRWASA